PPRPTHSFPLPRGRPRPISASPPSSRAPPRPPPRLGEPSYRGVRRRTPPGSFLRLRTTANRSTRPGGSRFRPCPELAFSRGRGSQGKQGRRGRSEPELLDAPRGPLFATSGVRSFGHDPPAAFGRITTLPFGRFKHLGPDSGVRSLYSPQV